jgi:hypothetical protein
MLDLAIQKSESVIARAVLMLVIAAIGMLGLVWLSIALAGWLSTLVSPNLATTITGASIVGLAGLAYATMRASGRKSESTNGNAEPDAPKNADVISRAVSIAERMAPETPITALVVALLAGIASVGLPDSLSPFLNKALDEVEK